MLCISRKSGQAVRIGEATVTVRCRRGKIELLIDAPKETEVRRVELEADEVKREFLREVGRAPCS